MAKTTELPPHFDFWYDIKTVGELIEEINNSMSILESVVEYREFLESNGVTFPYDTLEKLLTERKSLRKKNKKRRVSVS